MVGLGHEDCLCYYWFRLLCFVLIVSVRHDMDSFAQPPNQSHQFRGFQGRKVSNQQDIHTFEMNAAQTKVTEILTMRGVYSSSLLSN